MLSMVYNTPHLNFAYNTPHLNFAGELKVSSPGDLKESCKESDCLQIMLATT